MGRATNHPGGGTDEPGAEAEIEWQFEAQDLRLVLRWIESAAGGADPVTIMAGRTTSHVDTYLDTADRRLDRAGYSVRLRRSRRPPCEATLKSLDGAGPDALRVRLELAEPLERDDPDGPILSWLRRVEVEVPETSLAAVAPLVESLQRACGLQPTLLSKYEAALVASGRRRLELETFGPTAIEPSNTIGRVGLALLRRHFATMLAKEPWTRVGDDIEELHMRVASRRLRAALAVCGSARALRRVFGPRLGHGELAAASWALAPKILRALDRASR
jgi:inorganic triphosphatase YgiF